VPIVSFSISDSLLKEMELMADVMGYTSRSEVIRDALRSHISEQRMYRRAKDEVFNAVMFTYKDEESERNKVARVRSQFSKLIEGEVSFSISKDRRLTVFLAMGTSDELRMLTSRIRGIRGIEQTRYIMTEK
jgi:CopG family nickel-responsive transcriptional regulator